MTGLLGSFWDMRGQILPRQTLADDGGYHACKPGVVGALPLIEAEHLFADVPLEMYRIDRDVSPFHGTLEQAPEIFDPICVHGTPDIVGRVVFGADEVQVIVFLLSMGQVELGLLSE